ncbi:hypothetical protein [Streptomyces sp. AF1A]|uniref:hypothetical protein n=1 Tax=Streptomyces sp. AF1A TaxID=3394350 RepID=UPI0039BC4B65
MITVTTPGTAIGITVYPGRPQPVRIACHRDHRIAMAFSVLGLTRPHTFTLDDPHCVAKTFPRFHDELRRLLPWYELPVKANKSTEEHR